MCSAAGIIYVSFARHMYIVHAYENHSQYASVAKTVTLVEPVFEVTLFWSRLSNEVKSFKWRRQQITVRCQS